MTAFKPRRRFAQHFLIDEAVIERIIAVISPAPDECLVEIGPGLGALTRALVEIVRSLQVIELDRNLADELPRRLGNPRNLHVHAMDALTTDFTKLAGEHRLRIVGNLPYNISSPLLFHLLDHQPIIQDMHFMLQNEVVDRLAASPGNRDYGRLSVMVQLVCWVDKLFEVPPESFSPPPRVNSAVVRLVPAKTPTVLVDKPHFERVVRQAFSQRRKTLRNSLRDLLDENEIRAAGIDPGARPETLDLVGFAALSNKLSR